MGNVIGKTSTTNTHTRGTESAPMNRAFREQSAHRTDKGMPTRSTGLEQCAVSTM